MLSTLSPKPQTLDLEPQTLNLERVHVPGAGGGRAGWQRHGSPAVGRAAPSRLAGAGVYECGVRAMKECGVRAMQECGVRAMQKCGVTAMQEVFRMSGCTDG
eukprot:51701-Chlamydomonas_euryale.AAC.1